MRTNALSAAGGPATTRTLLRGGRIADAAKGGHIAYEAFRDIAARHGFPPDFPSPQAATQLIADLLARPDVHAIVAERDGAVVGSNFLWEGDPIAGVGPITVDPAMQDASTGRRLMQAVLARAAERRRAGVRLVQAAYHNRSLALYSKLGFVAREPLSLLQGPVPEVTRADRTVRLAEAADLEACDALGARLIGHPRSHELRVAVDRRAARIVEHRGRITGYTTGIGFFGHAAGETNDDVQSLIGAASAIDGPGFLVPTRNTGLMRWCLMHGLAIVQPMTLMSTGEWREPTGAYLPSILY